MDAACLMPSDLKYTKGDEEHRLVVLSCCYTICRNGGHTREGSFVERSTLLSDVSLVFLPKLLPTGRRVHASMAFVASAYFEERKFEDHCTSIDILAYMLYSNVSAQAKCNHCVYTDDYLQPLGSKLAWIYMHQCSRIGFSLACSFFLIMQQVEPLLQTSNKQTCYVRWIS